MGSTSAARRRHSAEKYMTESYWWSPAPIIALGKAIEGFSGGLAFLLGPMESNAWSALTL